MTNKRMDKGEFWIPTEDGKGMIPVNRKARRAYQKIRGGPIPKATLKPFHEREPEQKPTPEDARWKK